MEMFLKLFLIIIIRYTQAQPLLRTLNELNDRIQVTACSVSGAHCEGVMLLADWVVVLDSCIHSQKTRRIYVQKGVVNCTQGNHLEKMTPVMVPTKESSVRSVLARFSHPLAPNVDIALLRLDWPFADELGNGTLPFNALNIWDVWMESILYPYTEKTYWDETESTTEMIQYQMYASPIKMFFVTVILPSASFILFFLFIVFYTGTTDDTRNIPYKSLNNDKESSHV